MSEKKDVITVLEDLIRIDSRNPFHLEKPDENDVSTWQVAGNETEIAGYIENALEETGFRVEKQYVHTAPDGEKFYNVLGEKGSGDKSIVIYGHMDTVTSRPWLTEEQAFTPTRRKREVHGEEKETIVGLASSDMKAGVAAALTAFRNVDPDTHKIKLAFGVDEEYYSLGANVLAASDWMDDVKGIVIPEIGNGPNETFGASTIILGRLGRCEYVIDVPGTGGHGAHSYKERFINAATECAKIVARLDEMRKEHKDEFEFASKEVVGGIGENTIYGSFYVNRVEAGDGSLSVPSGGRIFVDWTFTPNFTIDYGLKKLRGLIEEMYESGELEKVMVSDEFRKITVRPRPRPTPASNAFITPPDHPFTGFIRKAIDETVGFKNYNMGFSVADENVFARIRPDIPVLVVGPLGDDCHVADEWITIDSLLELEKVFTRFGESFGLYI